MDTSAKAKLICGYHLAWCKLLDFVAHLADVIDQVLSTWLPMAGSAQLRDAIFKTTGFFCTEAAVVAGARH